MNKLSYNSPDFFSSIKKELEIVENELKSGSSGKRMKKLDKRLLKIRKKVLNEELLSKTDPKKRDYTLHFDKVKGQINRVSDLVDEVNKKRFIPHSQPEKQEFVYKQIKALESKFDLSIYDSSLHANPKTVDESGVSLVTSVGPVSDDSFELLMQKYVPGRDLPELKILGIKVNHNGSISVEDGSIDEVEWTMLVKTYDSIDDFKEENNILTVSDEATILSATKHIEFAHVWGLKGDIHITDQLCLEKEGNSRENSAKVLLDEISELSTPDRFSPNVFCDTEMKKSMERALLEMKELLKTRRENDFRAASNMLIELIDSGEPIIIPSGFQDFIEGAHADYFVYHNGHLAITNRGARAVTNKSGTYYFKVDPKQMKKALKDAEFARIFLGKCKKHEFLINQPCVIRKNTFAGAMVHKMGLEFVGFDPKRGQKVGNCSFANLISSMHALASLKTLKDGQDLMDHVHDLSLQYKVFTFEVRTNVMRKAALRVRSSSDDFIEDYDKSYIKMQKKMSRFQMSDNKTLKDIGQYYSDLFHEDIMAVRYGDGAEKEHGSDSDGYLSDGDTGYETDDLYGSEEDW